MKNKSIRPLLPALLAVLALAARAAVPVEWAADIDHPAPAQFAVMRGEAVRLRASLVRGGAPYDPAAESAALYYQTNGMGGTWWSAPATVSSNVLTADFTAAMDPGAPSVTAFLAATDADGAIYRAFAVMRFLHAPGAVPNALPLPAEVIDFAAVAVTNAPWALLSDVSDAISNATNGMPEGLAARLTRDEAEAGFTEWTFTGLYDGETVISMTEDDGRWTLLTSERMLENGQTSPTEWGAGDVTATRVRLRPTAEMEAGWDAKATPGDVAAAAVAGTNYTDAAIANIPAPDLSGYQQHNSAALGNGAQAASNGGAWGASATATATGAYQIGQGVNTNANSLQFRNFRLLDAVGTIPDERLSAGVRKGARFADATYVLWRELAERVEVLEAAQ